MNFWQITILALLFINLGGELYKNGEPKEGKHSFGLSVISTAIILFLYYKAGLFNTII